MRITMNILAMLVSLGLFWFGYTYSMTDEAFHIQGWIGATIPTICGLFLWALGYCAAHLERDQDEVQS